MGISNTICPLYSLIWVKTSASRLHVVVSRMAMVGVVRVSVWSRLTRRHERALRTKYFRFNIRSMLLVVTRVGLGQVNTISVYRFYRFLSSFKRGGLLWGIQFLRRFISNFVRF